MDKHVRSHIQAVSATNHILRIWQELLQKPSGYDFIGSCRLQEVWMKKKNMDIPGAGCCRDKGTV